MKKWTKLLTLFFLFSALLVSCEKTDDGSYCAPIKLYEKINGNWALNEIIQVDETAKITGIMPNEISLFNQFGFDNFKITLVTDESLKPSSYKVSGSVPELFPKEGFWDLNSEYPAATGAAPIINLYSDVTKEKLVAQLSIVSLPGAKDEMELKLTRKAAGVPFISYHYKLSTIK